MTCPNIIEKLKEHNLCGRSGSGFSTGLKWEMTKSPEADKKYIICNGAEGEPGVFKDGFILENYPEEVIEGIKIALETLDNSSAYIYLRKDYYHKFKNKLKKFSQGLPIALFKKTGGYVCGEATTAISCIEGKRKEPRMTPPFPNQSGLWGWPTLVNNVETFYDVAQIAKDKYKHTRFYSISGEVKNKGVYELPEDWSIQDILKKTRNWPDFDFFAQIGGAASGEILLPGELCQKTQGAGAIIIFNREKTNPLSLMKKWAVFFLRESCGKCTPCREGVYRIAEILKKTRINAKDKNSLDNIFFVLEKTSFCSFGKIVPTPFKSLIEKLKINFG